MISFLVLLRPRGAEDVRQCAVALECRATAALVRSLMELDVRRLYLGEGYSSLFTYCTQALHVWRRDEGRCAYTGREGRCTERGFLEYHHVRPYAAGGVATAANIELRCRAHNTYEVSLFFGRECDQAVEHPTT
jgi:hypothetical protein